MLPERKQYHLKNFDYASKDYPFFVTVCCDAGNCHLSDTRLADKISESILFLHDSGRSTVYCYCLMPDHVHIVLSLGDMFGKGLCELVTYFKRFTSKTAKNEFGIDKLWQKNFHEHVVRERESLRKICEYVLDNPVREGIVANREDYEYSRIVTPPPVY